MNACAQSAKLPHRSLNAFRIYTEHEYFLEKKNITSLLKQKKNALVCYCLSFVRLSGYVQEFLK